MDMCCLGAPASWLRLKPFSLEYIDPPIETRDQTQLQANAYKTCLNKVYRKIYQHLQQISVDVKFPKKYLFSRYDYIFSKK
jgi:hypothetical protein